MNRPDDARIKIYKLIVSEAKVRMLRHRRSVVRDQVDFDQTSSNLPISHSTGKCSYWLHISIAVILAILNQWD